MRDSYQTRARGEPVFRSRVFGRRTPRYSRHMLLMPVARRYNSFAAAQAAGLIAWESPLRCSRLALPRSPRWQCCRDAIAAALQGRWADLLPESLKPPYGKSIPEHNQSERAGVV